MDKPSADASQIQKLRDSLIDLLALCERMHCKTVEELVGIAHLALENDGQARLLLATLSRKP